MFVLFVGCIGCPRGWHCCGRWWGRCVCWRPGWDSCCWRIPDLLCNILNGICSVARRALDLALRAAIWVVDKSRHVLDVAKEALYVARGVVKAARKTLDAAIAFLEGVKRLYRIGVKALDALASLSLTQIITIREIYFNVGLNVANGGRFQCRVIGTLMSWHFNSIMDIDTRNIWSIARSLAERAFSGLSKFIG